MTINAAFEAAQEKARELGIDLNHGDTAAILDAFLLAGDYKVLSADGEIINPGEEMKGSIGYTKLLSVQNRIKKSLNAAFALKEEEGDWQFKPFFEELFEGNECFAIEVRDILNEMDRELPSYYDPDTTYKEDALAWVGAVDEFIATLEKQVAGEQKTEKATYSY